MLFATIRLVGKITTFDIQPRHQSQFRHNSPAFAQFSTLQPTDICANTTASHGTRCIDHNSRYSSQRELPISRSLRSWFIWWLPTNCATSANLCSNSCHHHDVASDEPLSSDAVTTGDATCRCNSILYLCTGHRVALCKRPAGC